MPSNPNQKSRTRDNDVTINTMASTIIGIRTVCSAICLGVHHRKYQSSSSLAFVKGIYRCPLDSLHKGPEMFPLMTSSCNNFHISIRAPQFCRQLDRLFNAYQSWQLWNYLICHRLCWESTPHTLSLTRTMCSYYTSLTKPLSALS